MNDFSHSIDINSLVNVILPLDLIKYDPFPSEISFDRLHHLIHDYLSKCDPSNNDNLIISPTFLFSICPIILERYTHAYWNYIWKPLEKLAMDLASFVNSWGAVEEEDTGLRWMRIRWIGADSQYTDFHVAGTRTSVAQEKTNEVTSEASDPTIPKRHHPLRLSLGHTCPNARPPKETEFRSGWCTCRTPRHSKTHRRVVSAPISRSPSGRNPLSAALAVLALPTPGTDRSSNHQVKW